MSRTKRMSRGKSKRVVKRRSRRGSNRSSTKRTRRSFIKKSRGRSKRSLRRMRGGAENFYTVRYVSDLDHPPQQFKISNKNQERIIDLKRKILNNRTEFASIDDIRIASNGQEKQHNEPLEGGATYYVFRRVARVVN